MGVFTPPRFIQRYLEPTTILNESVFGLVMALTFTLGAGLIIKEGPDATRELLIGVIGCNLAWGIIDGMILIMSGMLDRSRKGRLIMALRQTDSEDTRQGIVKQQIEPLLEPYIVAAEREPIYQAIASRLKGAEPERVAPCKDEVLAAIATVWLVFASTIPAVLPFLFLDDRFLALRMSNALLLAMLFIVGYRWALATNSRPWVVGGSLLLTGLCMVLIAIPLGG
jgi:VIT1/CCC1 family predicted Fe2+/Mn2+ transporter